MCTNTPTSSTRVATPLPKLQVLILLYFQFSEPITSLVFTPFINQMIYEYGITDDKRKVGYYAGTVISAFYLAEMLCVYHWGRISDKIGRRPVLMSGAIGLICANVSFGLSKTFGALIFSRALPGAINGNVGVMKSMLGEITDESNQAQAFSFLPLVWSVGTGVAQFVGGGLSHPYERFPKIFGHLGFWRDYPYALPCFVSAGICLSTLVLSSLFLKESLNTQNRKMGAKSYCTSVDTNAHDTLDDETSSTVRTALLPKKEALRPPLRDVLTPKVRAAILNYASFALLTTSFTSLQPLFLSTPIALGGLGLETPTIGLILGITGMLGGIGQMIFFAPLHRRFGTKPILLFAVTSFFVLFISWPIMNFLAKRSGKIDGTVIVLLIAQQLVSALCGMGFGCTHIFTTCAAPTRNSMGATNGLAQSLVSLARAIAPTGSASLFAFSITHNVLRGQLVYLVLIVLVFLALLIAMRLPKVVKRVSEEGGE